MTFSIASNILEYVYIIARVKKRENRKKNNLIIKLNIEFNINIILLLRGNKGLRLETSIHHPELIMKIALDPVQLFNLNPIIGEEYAIDIVEQDNAMRVNDRMNELNRKRFDNPAFFAGYVFYQFVIAYKNLYPNIMDYQFIMSAKSPNNIILGRNIFGFIDGCETDVYKTPNNDNHNYILIIRDLRGVPESIFNFKIILP